MRVQNKSIYVLALSDGSPFKNEFWLGKNIEFRHDRNKVYFSAVQYYNAMRLPTLAELAHAYFGKVGDIYISPEYRESVKVKIGLGEWTSTFLENGDTVVERPDKLVYMNGIWKAKGGKRTKVKLPKDGYILEYDRETGFPIETSQNKEDAIKIFGDDASSFFLDSYGLRPSRVFHTEQGLFHIDLCGKLDTHDKYDSRTGAREYRQHKF